MTISECDSSKTSSGLPAPQGWHIAEYIYDEQGTKAGKLWERLAGERLTVMDIESFRIQSGMLRKELLGE